MTKLMVFANAKPGRDEEFNDWYNAVHLQDLLDIPGVVRGERFRAAAASSARVPAAEHQFLAVYEIDGDVDAVLAELNARVADGRMVIDDSVDPNGARFTVWEPEPR
jgi:hypothetical protein